MGRQFRVSSVVCMLACTVLTDAADPQSGQPSLTGFVDASSVPRLESVLADQAADQPWRLRWRIHGTALDPRALSCYERGWWQPMPGVQAGVVVERDAGEPGWADFSAGFVRVHPAHGRWTAVFGDLLPGWASGLVCARSAGMGALPLSQPADDSRWIAYRSASENRALRGMALAGRTSRSRWTLLAGSSWRDARLDAAGRAVSLPGSGRHVTPTQIHGRDRFRLDVVGGRWQHHPGGWHVGGSILAIHFGRPLDLRRPRRKPWAFHGRRLILGAMDGVFRLGGVSGRGEAALDHQGHGGLVAGLKGRMARVRWRLLMRGYGAGFTSFFGGAPSRAGMENERGAMICLAGSGWQLFADGYRRPRRSYYYPLPATVTSLGGRGWWRGPGATGLALQAREDRRPRWHDGGVQRQTSRLLRVDISRRPLVRWLTLVRLRLQGRHLRRDPGTREWGWALGVLGKAVRPPLSLVLHGTCYRTPSYASALYCYEYDLPGMVSVRPLYMSGWRGYVVARAHLGSLQVDARYRCEQRERRRHEFGLQVELGQDL